MIVSGIAAITFPISFVAILAGNWGDPVQRAALRQPVLGKAMLCGVCAWWAMSVAVFIASIATLNRMERGRRALVALSLITLAMMAADFVTQLIWLRPIIASVHAELNGTQALMYEYHLPLLIGVGLMTATAVAWFAWKLTRPETKAAFSPPRPDMVESLP